MKTGDLRIGNWYTSVKFGVPVRCELTDFSQLDVMSDGAYDDPPIDEVFEPIPLTEEWLLKFGFKKAEKKIDIFPESFIKDNVMKSRLYLRLSHKGGYYWGFLTQGIRETKETDHEFYDIQPMLYVHQLQNLYFTLAGTELEVKTA